MIVLSQYGPGGPDVCIGPPLAATECSAGLAGTNGQRFFHYDINIDSFDPLCKLLDTFDRPDTSGRTPGGWQEYLRPAAQKAFVLITDDSAHCMYEDDDVSLMLGEPDADPFEDALMFHSALLARSPEQFGVATDGVQFFTSSGCRRARPHRRVLFRIRRVRGDV